MSHIAGLVSQSAAGAVEIAGVATDMQRTSEMLCVGIPEIARKATRAEMRWPDFIRSAAGSCAPTPRRWASASSRSG
jgi:hypothetical protein